MSRIAVIGLGRMGAPIARRLTDAGHDVVGFDLDSAVTLRSVVTGADVVLTVLPGAPEFAAVTPEIISAAGSGAVWVDLTSNDPRVAEGVAELATAEGMSFVGAPMGGGPADAAGGTLRLYVGGTGIDRVRPVLDVIGEVECLGDGVGAGYVTKLIANLLWFGQVIAVTEALLLGQSLGISPLTLRRVLPRTAGASYFIDVHLDHLLDGDYLANFELRGLVDELEILEQLAAESRVPFGLSSLIASTHRDALRVFGDIDGELLAARLLEERAGVFLRGEDDTKHERA